MQIKKKGHALVRLIFSGFTNVYQSLIFFQNSNQIKKLLIYALI